MSNCPACMTHGMGQKNRAFGKLIIHNEARVMRINPATGKLQAYLPCIAVHVGTHTASVPTDLPSRLQSQFNTNYGVGVVVVEDVYIEQGVFTDFYAPSYLVSEEAALDSDRRLMPIIFWEIIGVFLAVCALIGIIYFVLYTFLIKPTLQYVPPNGADANEGDLWENKQILSWLNAHYWLVCGKDYTGFAPRAGAVWKEGFDPGTTYTNYEDIPQSAKDTFEEHCSSQYIPDLRPPEWWTGTMMQIVYVAIAVGGIYLAIKILPPLFSGARTRDRLPPPPSYD